jgi:hypothetical protein
MKTNPAEGEYGILNVPSAVPNPRGFLGSSGFTILNYVKVIKVKATKPVDILLSLFLIFL